MNDPSSVDKKAGPLKKEIFDISNKIYRFAEVGSEEVKSSSLLAKSFEKKGFKVVHPYLGISTAFRAEWGEGEPAVAIIAEYDALPNGHSCGHNLISGWAYGTSVALSKLMKKGKVVVLGTPSEEGIGKYAGSKALLIEKGALDDIDFAIGLHAMDSWSVGWKTLSDVLFQAIFKGKASHMAYSPERGVNALDAVVTSYVSINNLRSWIKNDRLAIIEMIIREGGTVTSIVTDRAVLEIELKAVSGEFLKVLERKVTRVLEGVSKAYGTRLEIRKLQPMYEDYVANSVIDSMLENSLRRFGVKPSNMDTDDSFPSVSSDEGNISKVVPTGHLNMKIGYPGMALHSAESAKEADPALAIGNLMISVRATVDAVERIMENENILRRVRREFRSRIER